MKPDDQSSVSRARLAVAPLSVLLAASVVFSWSSGMSENKRFLNTIDANALLRSALQFDFDRYAFSLDYQVVAGSPASPGQLVIVGSLACRHCRNLLREAEALPEVIAKDVGVSFVPFPVSSACNPRVREEERSHRERCRLAERTLKEQLKGNFWPWFRSVDGQPGITIRSLREPDREAAQWSQTLKDQIASLNDIPVYSIPALFWNGQKLPSFVNEFSLEDLLALLIEIEKEVESTREIEGCDEC